MTGKILICTDLDRTLLPNGDYPESDFARCAFSALVQRPEIVLVYVTGRHKALVEQAITEYYLPQPNFVIGDVGTSIYSVKDGNWQEWPQWIEEIAPDWQGRDHAAMQQLFNDLSELMPQECSKQNLFKLSYYISLTVDWPELLNIMRSRLIEHHIRAELIYSVDEAQNTGLLDVLPASATKLHAVNFLMLQLGFNVENTVFAGDSGNDLAVLASPIKSVLVANASEDVRQEAVQLAQQHATSDALYLAKGDFMGMNGNYSAGILEGIAHFLPHTQQWMKPDD